MYQTLTYQSTQLQKHQQLYRQFLVQAATKTSHINRIKVKHYVLQNKFKQIMSILNGAKD